VQLGGEPGEEHVDQGVASTRATPRERGPARLMVPAMPLALSSA
jgi:hypothetical protein